MIKKCEFEVSEQAYLDFVLQKYNREIQCENNTLVILNESKERVCELVSDLGSSCYCSDEILAEATYIMSFYRQNYSNYDEEDTFKEYERTAYLYLKNRDCIRF